jgi:hypothetical protein
LVKNTVAILVNTIFPFLSQFFIFCNASNCWVLQLGHATRPTTVGIIKIHPLLVVLSTNSLVGYRHHRRHLNLHFTLYSTNQPTTMVHALEHTHQFFYILVLF